jgi:hypothetical protein
MHWILIGSVLLLTAAGNAQDQEEGAADFRRRVCATLSQKLQGSKQLYSGKVLEELARETDLEEARLREQLLGLLDELDQQREKKTGAWEELLALGGKEIEAKQAGKFLRELGKGTRKALKKKGNYGLEQIVNQAAGKAKLLPYQGKELLQKILQVGAGEGAGGSVGLPDEIGLLVEGRSNYRIEREGFAGLLIRAEDQLQLKKVTDIHAPIVAALVGELPSAEWVRWVIEKPRPQLQPECRLLFEIEEFSSATGMAPEDQPMPAVYMVADITLEQIPTGASVYHERLEFRYDFWMEEDEEIQSQRRLDRFYEKVARQTREALDRFWEKR